MDCFIEQLRIARDLMKKARHLEMAQINARARSVQLGEEIGQEIVYLVNPAHDLEYNHEKPVTFIFLCPLTAASQCAVLLDRIHGYCWGESMNSTQVLLFVKGFINESGQIETERRRILHHSE